MPWDLEDHRLTYAALTELCYSVRREGLKPACFARIMRAIGDSDSISSLRAPLSFEVPAVFHLQ